MPRTCSICDRPDRDAIEHATVSGGSLRGIAGRYGVAKSSLSRHLGNHLPAAVVEEAQVRDADRVASLGERLEDLYTRAEAMLREAEGAGRHNVSLASIRELRNILEFASKLAGLPEAQTPVIHLTFADGGHHGRLRMLPPEGS